MRPLNRPKVDCLLILRGLACLGVLIWHVEPPKEFLFFKGINLSFLTFPSGFAALWIFFLLSGYLIGKVFFTGKYDISFRGVVNFYYNRILRIFPLYYFNIIFLSVVFYSSLVKTSPEILIRLLTFTANDFFRLKTFNPPIWAVSAEVQFYLFAPLFFVIFYAISKKKIPLFFIGPMILLAGLFVRIAFVQLFNASSDIFRYVSLLYSPLYGNLDVFLFGFCINLAFRDKDGRVAKWHGWANKKIALLLLVILYFFTSYASLHFVEQYYIYKNLVIFIMPFMTALFVGYFILAFEAQNYWKYPTSGIRLSLKGYLKSPLKLFETLGILSYGIYLWHRPVIDHFGFGNSDNVSFLPFLTKLTGAFLTTLLFALITYIGIELPLSRKKR